jgi:hypothetical protein
MSDVATAIALTLRTAHLALGRLLLWVKGHKATAPPLRLKERAHLPIRPYLADQAFDPGTIRNMSLAFENVCEVLGLTVSDDPGTRAVAAKILALTRSGEHDVATLRAMAIQGVQELIGPAVATTTAQHSRAHVATAE